jgi:hypothetical protein
MTPRSPPPRSQSNTAPRLNDGPTSSMIARSAGMGEAAAVSDQDHGEPRRGFRNDRTRDRRRGTRESGRRGCCLGRRARRTTRIRNGTRNFWGRCREFFQRRGKYSHSWWGRDRAPRCRSIQRIICVDVKTSGVVHYSRRARLGEI